MSNSFSCATAKPFVKLGDDSNAPVLNYNLPQNTCYRVNGFFPVPLADSVFDPAFSSLPANNPWDFASNLSLVEITATLRQNILHANAPELLLNHKLLRKRKDLIKLLPGEPTAILEGDGAPETYVVSESQLRVARMGNEGASTAFSSRQRRRVNHATLINTIPADRILIAGFTLEFIAEQISNGFIPELYVTFGGKVLMRFLPKPSPRPMITIIEHYKMCSYLGDYGAGKTLKTFSLLPGEKTTLTMRSFRDRTSSYTKSSSTSTNEYSSTYFEDDETSIAERSEHVLDSFSQYSANQVQSAVEALESTSDSAQVQTGNQISNSGGGGVQGGINIFGLVNFQAGGGTTNTTTTSSGSNSIRENHMSTLESALESSVTESGQYRDVEVNATTGNVSNQSSGGTAGGSSTMSVSQTEQMLVKAGEENLTVRHLQNINYSRVLNFVFRQMLQEYIVLTYLHDVSIQFSNGVPSQTRTVKLNQLPALIEEVIPNVSDQNDAFTAIMQQLCNVVNYQGTSIPFAEKTTQSLVDCVGGTGPKVVEYWRKQAGLSDSYTSGGLTLSVDGIITSVSSHILRTDSVIVDALLGQGEALDCYNSRLQDAAALAAEQQNARYLQETTQEQAEHTEALNIIGQITDPIEKANAFKKMLGECCPEDMVAMAQSSSSGGSI